jgi:hypothetical protein
LLENERGTKRNRRADNFVRGKLTSVHGETPDRATG